MTKTILFLLAFFGFYATISAQSFSVSSTFASQQGNTQQDIAPPITIKNNTNRTLEIRWERDKINLPDGWEIQFCDKQCRTTETGSFTLAPNETLTNVRVNFKHNGNGGIGTTEITFYDASNRMTSETSVYFTASVQGSTLSSVSAPNKAAQYIYPNPATDFINLQDDEDIVKHLEIFNMVGRKILDFNVSTKNGKFDIGNLPLGMYMVRMLDGQRNIIRTQRISKYNP